MNRFLEMLVTLILTLVVSGLLVSLAAFLIIFFYSLTGDSASSILAGVGLTYFVGFGCMFLVDKWSNLTPSSGSDDLKQGEK